MNIKRQKRNGTLAARLGPYSVSAAAALALAPASSAKITDITSFTITSGFSASTSAPSLDVPTFVNSPYMLGLQFGAGFYAGLVCSRSPTNGATKIRLSNTVNLEFAGKGEVASGGPAGRPIVAASVHSGGEDFSFFHGYLAYKLGTRKFGYFAPPKSGARTGFVDFRNRDFRNPKSGQTYYGWLRVKVDGNSSSAPDFVSLVAENGVYGAYGLKSDDILVGETAVPEPTSPALSGLALLALGATGVREMRRRKAAARQPSLERRAR
jgi:hypothetical protein